MASEGDASSKMILEAAALTGLKPHEKWLFGRYRGYPVAVRELGAMENYQTVFQVVLPSAAVPAVSAAAADKDRLKAAGLSRAAVRVDGTTNILLYVHRPAIRTKPEDIPRFLETLLSFANAGGGPPPEACAQDGRQPAQVVIVRDSPVQLCAEHLEELRRTLGQYQAAQKAAKVNYVRAAAFGVVGLLAGAGIWAGIGIASGSIFSVAAFGIAGLIAFLLAWGAKTVNLPLILVMTAFTLLAIFLGETLWVAMIIVQLGGPFDLGLALGAYFEYLAAERTAGLSYFFGALGAFGAGWYMMRAARQAKRQFDLIA